MWILHKIFTECCKNNKSIHGDIKKKNLTLLMNYEFVCVVAVTFNCETITKLNNLIVNSLQYFIKNLVK